MRKNIVLDLREIRRLIEGVILQYGRCPRCGRPLPEDIERFELSTGRYFCHRCGQEWGVTPDA